jgi:capsular polysaccharide biosynthesis protein
MVNDVNGQRGMGINPDIEQEIDLIELAQKFWKARKFIGKVCGVAGIVAIIVAFSIPEEYSTVVKMAPELGDAAKKTGTLAALTGMNLGGSSSGDAISPDLYPDVVQSIPFLVELFSAELTREGQTQEISFYNYLIKYHQKPWWADLVGLPFKGINWWKNIFSSKIPVDEIPQQRFISLTKEQQEIVELLQKKLNVSVDKKTLVITATVSLQDPVISAQVAQLLTEKLQSYITNYRTQKAKQDYDFTLRAFTDARMNYYKAQEAYAAFEDGNRNIISASYRTEQIRLQNDMSLAFGIYNTLAQKLEQDKLRIQEQTPVYTVIEPASVPLKASSPKKLLILAGFIFLAFFGAIGYLMVKDSFLLRLQEIKRETA